MSRRARSTQRGTYFHVIYRSARRLVLFTQPGDYRAFLSILNQALERHPVRLIAYVLMPNHWHLVVGPTDTTTLSRCLHWVTSTHARRLHGLRTSSEEVPVYQGRIASVDLPAVDDLVRVCRHVERDALQARLVRRAQDWPWSSLADRLQPSQGVPLVNTPFLSSRAWVEYVNSVRAADSGQTCPDLMSPLDHVAEAPSRFA